LVFVGIIGFVSGHSKWSTIKHKKAATDAVRGKLFSKLSRAISVAVKTGGGSNPEANSKLKVAIEQAKSANMPKANIQRAITCASAAGDIQEVVYEGFGPSGVGVLVEVVTNNRNRTVQEVKNIFERAGGSLGEPGSVSFNFKLCGLIITKKQENPEDQILAIIDSGAEDVEETNSEIEVYVSLQRLGEMRKKLEEQGFFIVSCESFRKPSNLHQIRDVAVAKKTLSFLSELENHDDVQKVYANLDIPDRVLKEIKS
jgi:YebC/PmpR family DNA-binding regulatory protein